MIAPKDYYKKNKDNLKLHRDSYKFFINKYHLGRNDPNGFKLNERELFKNSSKNFFIPGKIYTFQYDPLYKSQLDYYDTRPIVLCHNIYRSKVTKNDIMVGINLNLLPNKIKTGTLQIFYERFKHEIEKGEYAASKKNIYISSKLISALRDWMTTINIYRSSNINYDFSYRQYIRSRIKLASLVEYDDWNLISFIRPEDILGKSLNEIYKEYFEYQKKNK